MPPDLAEIQGSQETTAPRARIPFVTYGLIALLFIIFVCELVFGVETLRDGKLSRRTLMALGGVNWNLVTSGGWWRLFTAPFLHLDIFHLGMNCLVLGVAGSMLERITGSTWFAAVYLVSAVCGSLLSIALNPSDLLSVGASGAITGVVAAMWVTGFRFPVGSIRKRLQRTALLVLVLALLLPIATAASGTRVDLAAHAGGALGGAGVAWIMFEVWLLEGHGWPSM